MKPSIVHVELAADDTDRARKFYNDLFGWKTEYVPGMDHISVIIPPIKDGKIAGGMMKREMPEQVTHVYVGVDSIDTYVEKAKGMGSKIHKEKTAVKGMGYFAIISDSEENPLGLWEDDESAE